MRGIRQFWDHCTLQQRAALCAVLAFGAVMFACGGCCGASVLTSLAVMFG